MLIKKTTSSRIIIHNTSLALIKNATNNVAKILLFLITHYL